MMQFLIAPKESILGYYYWAKTVDNLNIARDICEHEKLVSAVKKSFPHRDYPVRKVTYYKNLNTKQYIVVILVSDAAPYKEIEEKFRYIAQEHPELKEDIKVSPQQVRDIFEIPE